MTTFRKVVLFTDRDGRAKFREEEVALPKGTPQAFVSKIHAAMMKALAVPELKQRFFDNGVAAAPVTPEEFTKFVNAETVKWQKAVTISGAKIE